MKRHLDLLVLIAAFWAAFLLGYGEAQAQPIPTPTIDNQFFTPGGNGVVGEVQMCKNINGAMQPCFGTPITANATGTTAITTATLTAVAGKTTYICGFTINATATAAINANTATITGLVTSNWTFLQAVGATPAIATQTQTFTPCIPASATNTAIGVNSIAAGTAGLTSVAAWGYQL